MQRPSTNRALFLIALSAGMAPCLAIAPLHAQQTASALPASAPTNGLTFTLSTDHPASVSYKDGRLSVIADNTSLNQILNAISRVTGMKVTGTVADEHVFGNYGPDTPTRVLTALLEGTSSNVLITQNLNHTPGVAPIELVLTPRGGPPTPPNPHPQPFDNGSRSEPVTPYPIASPPPPPPTTATPAGIPGAAAPGIGTPGTDPNPAGLSGGAGTSSSGTTLQQSPNDIKTPQQIYEQLQQLRQQQQQQQQQGHP
jgi:hypothetical protein